MTAASAKGSSSGGRSGSRSVADLPVAPVYLVKGGDEYLVECAVLELSHRLAGGEDRAAFAVDEYRAGSDPMDAVVAACQTPPFLSDRRVVVVRDGSSIGAEGARALASYLAEPLDTTSLVVSFGSGRVLQTLEKAVVQAGGEVVDTSVPSGNKGRNEWIAQRVAALGMRLDPGALSLLTDHVGEDVNRVDGILAAVSAAYGPRARVGEEELEPFLGAAGNVPPWDLTDAIDRGDAAQALRFLARMSGAGGRHALAVLAILHKHYAAMLALDGSGVRSDTEAAEVLGVGSAFRAGKLRAQAERLGSPAIARAITLLSAADLDVKGASGLEPQVVMEILVARLSRLGSRRVPERSRRHSRASDGRSGRLRT